MDGWMWMDGRAEVDVDVEGNLEWFLYYCGTWKNSIATSGRYFSSSASSSVHVPIRFRSVLCKATLTRSSRRRRRPRRKKETHSPLCTRSSRACTGGRNGSSINSKYGHSCTGKVTTRNSNSELNIAEGTVRGRNFASSSSPNMQQRKRRFFAESYSSVCRLGNTRRELS